MACMACLSSRLFLMQSIFFRHKFTAFLLQLWGRRRCGVFCSFQCLCWNWSVHHNVRYVAYEDMVDSSLSTLTVTYLRHVTEVLSPAYNAGTLFYKVNVSLTYSVDASARSDVATGFTGVGKAAHAIFTVHSTAPAYHKIEGACLGPQGDHNNLHRVRLLQPWVVLTS